MSSYFITSNTGRTFYSSITNTFTDDFLCAHLGIRLFYKVHTFMKIFVHVTTQEGSILKYLNLWIIQSPYSISFNQSEHFRDSNWINSYRNPVNVSRVFILHGEPTMWPNEKSRRCYRLTLKNSRHSITSMEAYMQLSISMTNACISWFCPVQTWDIQ